MIADEVQAHALEMIAAGLRDWPISRRLGISHHSVARIRRRGTVRPRAADPLPSPRPVGRCPRCGSLLTSVPCQACRTRLLADPRRRPADRPDDDDGLRLALRPFHRQRYEALRCSLLRSAG